MRTINKIKGSDLEKTNDEQNSQFREPKLLQVISIPKILYAEIEKDKEKFYYPVYCLGLYKYGNKEPLVVPIVLNDEQLFDTIDSLFSRGAGIYNLLDHIPELEK